ncbi:PolC-type DNA polymerase III [Thermosediminibacter litoriperuensis]|uniref:DNA polymerase III PolC-type n=1 Tax=Thermosediminibacter litoriperuensis TaxID=291989 RepID=A0A5S5ASU8_9FIRM|nr:PolC-type DNA polymerase III [Thermosediminibacter litoriperuensis]TYP54289.1 DNA polymerase III catalytic subunit PolC type [Thermosediminibacter litoriperuensis]
MTRLGILLDLSKFSDKEKQLLEKTAVKKVAVSTHERTIKIELSSEEDLSQDLVSKVREELKEKLKGCCAINLCFSGKSLCASEDATEVIQEKWAECLKNLFRKVASARIWMLNCTYEYDKGTLFIYIEKNGIEYLQKKKCSRIIEEFFQKLGINLKVSFEEKEQVEYYDISEEDRQLVEALLSSDEVKTEAPLEDYTSADLIFGRDVEGEPVSLKEIAGEAKEIIVNGRVFEVACREIKNDTKLVTFGLTDGSGSLAVKIFASNDKKCAVERIQEGIWVKIRGRVEKNSYSEELELIPHDIKIIPKPMRSDNSSEKRVELHLHTRYSAMDAVCSPKEVIELCKHWGHKAVAFTDHGVVQSFPEVYEAAKAAGLKPIYGVEAYVFDDEYPVMTEPPEGNIDDFVYVVTDIETTGLSLDTDAIIEIGAVKVYRGQIVDRFHSFVNPGRPVSPYITNLTGINNAMVSQAPPIKDVMSDFLRFIGNDIFVAHNAEFDSGFIRRDCARFGIEFNNKVMDTLNLSALIFPELKNHRLDTIAKKFNINMGRHHRADDDANTAALILIELLKKLKEQGIDDLSMINRVNKKAAQYLNSYHAIILVKNNQGLRNLYKLVSISHLEYFYRNPRIPKSLLKKYRDGLIVGSGCEAGELFQSLIHHRSCEDIKRIVSFYDFLEIQPLQNNNFLIEKGILSNEKKLQEINKKIYQLGKMYNKPVVITGDVHFLNPEDETYRKILLTVQGYKDNDISSGLYLKTTEEMLNECQYLGEEAAREVVIENPNSIADEIEDGIKPVPDELYPPKIEGADEEIVNMTYSRAKEIYGEELPEIVKKRIERELNSIVSNGYSVIYLIAHKLVKKSLDDGYLVGSRGSVGSSLVATMCGITEVNPLPPHYLCPKCKNSIFPDNVEGIVGPDLSDKNCPTCGCLMKKDGYNIPFEVFMGFEGDKVPDIDLNFSGEYQPIAHKYTEELFGKNNVFRAGTISTIAEKTAYGFVRAYLEEKKVTASEYEIKRLAAGITGVKRTTGQHPGGLMVLPKDKEIFEFTPIQYPADDKESGVITTHFDYHSISERLLKLDLLGHDDPTVIKMLEEETGIDAKKIPLDDRATMAIFSSLEPLGLKLEDVGTTVGTLGVPEFGTRFVRQMLEETRPTTFSELIRISGLSHGTDVWLNNAQDLIKNKVATLKEVIATRDDIMIHLIEKGIDHKVAFNIMERVRKGKGLKPEEEQILTENGIEQWFIDSCKKIKYMFPKAHAVAYVIMAFRIAYFKVHYPEAFYATYFTVRADDFDAELILQGPKKIKEVIEEINKKEKSATPKEKNLLTILEVANEMYMRGIQFIPIDLYKSHYSKFIITKDGILPPLTALPGLGLSAAQSIYNERQKGEFASVEDLRMRTRVTRNVVEILRQNGVLNGLQETNQISLF